jgi:hypothetical protein
MLPIVQNMVTENVADITAGMHGLAERVAYRYASVEQKHHFRFLFDPLRQPRYCPADKVSHKVHRIADYPRQTLDPYRERPARNTSREHGCWGGALSIGPFEVTRSRGGRG